MIDASSKPFEENIAITKRLRMPPMPKGWSSKELTLSASKNMSMSVKPGQTHRPDQATTVTRTGVDSLAVPSAPATGDHRNPGISPTSCGHPKTPAHFLLVMHGSSSVRRMKSSVSMPADRGAPKASMTTSSAKPPLGVTKINIDADGRLSGASSTALRNIRRFDSRPAARIHGRLCDFIAAKNVKLGSANQLDGVRKMLGI